MRYFYRNPGMSLWVFLLTIFGLFGLLNALEARIDRVHPSEASLYNRALLAECLDYIQVVFDQTPKAQYTRVLQLDGEYFNTVRYTTESALSRSYLPHRYRDNLGNIVDVACCRISTSMRTTSSTTTRFSIYSHPYQWSSHQVLYSSSMQ